MQRVFILGLSQTSASTFRTASVSAGDPHCSFLPRTFGRFRRRAYADPLDWPLGRRIRAQAAGSSRVCSVLAGAGQTLTCLCQFRQAVMTVYEARGHLEVCCQPVCYAGHWQRQGQRREGRCSRPRNSSPFGVPARVSRVLDETDVELCHLSNRL